MGSNYKHKITGLINVRRAKLATIDNIAGNDGHVVIASVHLKIQMRRQGTLAFAADCRSAAAENFIAAAGAADNVGTEPNQ